jgi:hypothetical protein
MDPVAISSGAAGSGARGSGGPLGAAAGAGARSARAGSLRVGAAQRELLAQSVPPCEGLLLTPDGLQAPPRAAEGPAGGGLPLGCGRLEALLRVTPAAPPLPAAAVASTTPCPPPSTLPYVTPAALSAASAGAGGRCGICELHMWLRAVRALARAHPPPGPSRRARSGVTHMLLELGSLELSLVDARPEEVALLSLDGLSAELASGVAAGVAARERCGGAPGRRGPCPQGRAPVQRRLPLHDAGRAAAGAAAGRPDARQRLPRGAAALGARAGRQPGGPAVLRAGLLQPGASPGGARVEEPGC